MYERERYEAEAYYRKHPGLIPPNKRLDEKQDIREQAEADAIEVPDTED